MSEHPGEPSFTTAAVRVADGWHGRVLVAWRLADGTHPAASATLDAADWTPALQSLVGEAAAGHTRLKDSGGVTVSRAELRVRARSLQVVCKLARDVGSRAGISRAARSFDRAVELLKSGIQTPLPLAALQRRGKPTASLLVTELIEGGIDLDAIMSWRIYELKQDRALRVKRRLADRLADTLARLARGWHHRDIKASNILVTDWQRDPRVWLVDLDGLAPRRWWRPRNAERMLIRLAASLAGNRSFTRTVALRFLRSFDSATGRGPAATSTEHWKTRYRRLARGVERYNKAARGRKRGKLDAFLGE